MKHIAVAFALSGLAWSGCSERPEGAGPQVAESFAPLPEATQAAAVQQGRAIVAETFSLLSSNLQTAIRQGGVSNALPFCSLTASPLTSGLAAKHGVTIRRFTHKPRNAADQADAAELRVLDRFRAGLVGTNVPAPFVTNMTASYASFFMPIVLNNELCLKCHGAPEKDIQLEHLAVIRRLYPGDEAVGFKLGELRGAWRIDLPLGSLPIKAR